MLEAKNILVGYGDRTVLRGVSLSLRSGEITALLGANGAGKTTLIRSLNGTLPLSGGNIELGGRSLSAMSRREIAHRVAVVAQENETRFPVTVLEFVLSGRFVHGGAFGWESETDIEQARGALRECDLAIYEGRLMNHLSGGERQRVVLARALATGAKVMLLDEPTANLDLAHQGLMFRLVRDRCKVHDHAAIIITHDLNLAAEFADQIIMLQDGRIAAEGPPAEVLSVENIKGMFGVDVLLDKNPASGNVRVTTVF